MGFIFYMSKFRKSRHRCFFKRCGGYLASEAKLEILIQIKITTGGYTNLSEFVIYDKILKQFYIKMEERNFTKCAQLHMISELEMAKIKTGKKDRRQYYLPSTYYVLSIAEEKFLIHKQNASDKIIRQTMECVKLAIVKKTMNRKIVIKPITATDFNERAQIDLMDFQSVPV
ncbi:hypothetical protein AGLY_016044 [Aphis glycines]|uniref:Uncharacterized protein n=1 Tax=Aphis glycines TaxID=307491 RepID=A0A6G0SZ10_APHGL|nr:hypothetical protein AGLY_016044 [Aphis glycines]